MKRKSSFYALVIVLLLVGCTTSSYMKTIKLDEKKAYWFSYDATRRGALLIPRSLDCRVCAEQSPDVVLESVGKILAQVSYQQANGAINYEWGQHAVELGKRSVTVAFLRESLFRLCELSINLNASKEEILKRFDDVIAAAKELAIADREAAKVQTLKEICKQPDNIRSEMLKGFKLGE